MPGRKERKVAPLAAPDISLVGDRVIVVPRDESLADSRHETHDRNLVEHMARLRESPLDFLRDLSLHIQGSGWRSYENIVGQPIFYPGFTESVKRDVLSTGMLRAKITNMARQRLNEETRQGLFDDDDKHDHAKAERRLQQLDEDLKQVAEKMLDDMVCKMESKPFIRSAYYAVTALLTRAYHQGIHVSSNEVLRLRGVAEEAAGKKQSIIFLPSHRSHVDYVALQLVCYRLGLALPIVVAGDNLNFPLLGSFLQHAGAMWIRRSFGDDSMYVTVVQAYIDTLLTRGFNFECFIEGGRSRIGKLLPPKFGILSFLLDSVLSGRVEDAFICPCSTQYDKVIEVDSYINELLGQPKRKENLKDFLSASSILSLKLGRIDLRFHEPWSLKGFIDEHQRRMESSLLSRQGKLESRLDIDVRTRLLRTLGYKVLADINAISVIMPTSLIGTVLLTLRGRGVGKSELVRRVNWLSERVRAQGGRVAHFAGQPLEVVVERGLEVLGPSLVGVEDDLVEPTYFAVDRFQLSFYRNMTIHLFISQALVSVSLYTHIKAGGQPETQIITYGELFSQVSFLSQLFRGEFIFATAGLEANLLETINGLDADRVVTVKRQFAETDIDSAITHIELNDIERAEGRNNFDFYCFLIWPFVEASWLGAVSLLMLVPPVEAVSSEPWLSLVSVRDSAQLLGKTLYAQGDLSYFEAVNKETLRNAYNRFEEDGLLVTSKSGNNPNEREGFVRLSSEWTPSREATGAIKPSGRLWEFCEEISRHRLEGKHRRDGGAAVERVLGLIEQASSALWNLKAQTEGPARSSASSNLHVEGRPKTAGKRGREKTDATGKSHL